VPPTAPGVSAAPAAPAIPRPSRDPWFDNAKMALVTLVVVGHSWTLLPHGALNDHLYDFLYVWHIPAFVLVTGYLSRSFDWTGRRLWQLVRTVLVPYLLFECLLALFRVHVGGEKLEDLFQDPHWPMWYLAALFFWRLLTPVFRPLWGGLVAAVAISLVAGVSAGDTLDMARVLGLLPFFVLGLKATPEHLERLRQPWARKLALVVFVGIAALTFWTDALASTEWLYYRSQYDELGVSAGHAVLIRLGLLVLGTLGACAFLALVPRTNGWFTRMGAATVVVYLVHGFVVKGAEYAGYIGWASEHTAVSLVVTTGSAVALALLLAWDPVSRRLAALVDPFGYAERRVTDAVDLVAARADADEIAETLHEATHDAAGDRTLEVSGAR
jgi:fucose 4-O-acetylase-like acetyltransferase